MKAPSLSQAKRNVAKAYRTDANLNRVKSWYEPVKRRLPSATAEYLAEKLPVVQWLPHYDYRWLLQDVLAGITIGVMLIPQGLSYAKIAEIPVEHGLYSSWFPSALYFFLGTSKDLSTGPTSVLGLFTSEAVRALSSDGYSPADIASAMAFMVGVYALVLGMLKLGFLLDFVSAPVLSGWISAVAVVIGLGQVDSLVGISNVRDGTANIIHDVLTQLNTIQPLTLAIGFTGIAVLWGMQEMGKRWGKRNRWIKLLATSRAVIVLVVYTLISWGVNHGLDEDDYKWDVAGVDTKGLPQPKSHHDSSLLSKIASRSVAPLIAMSVEHLGTGKAFSLRNDYSLDKSQELVFLGANNMVNSLFGAMTTGAAMSRTAVNSECGVRSPLSFLLTAAWIILTLYEFAPALYWIPKATLAAIIIMAVAHLVSTPPVFYRYWRMSFLDFIASQIGLWVTLFTSTEIGLAVSVGWSLVYTLLRLAFPRWIGLSHIEADEHPSMIKHLPRNDQVDIPPEVFLARFNDDALFPNAERIKNSIIESIKVHYEPPVQQVDQLRAGSSIDRTWNPASHKKIEKLRRRKGIQPIRDAQLRYVVLDFTKMAWIDVSGVFSIIELKMELRRYVGEELGFRFYGMAPKVKERFDRDGWEFAVEGEEAPAGTDVIYERLERALVVSTGSEKVNIVTEKSIEV